MRPWGRFTPSTLILAALALAHATHLAAEPVVWGNLSIDLPADWRETAMDDPTQYYAEAADGTRRIVVTRVVLPDTPRSFDALATRAFFWGLKREAKDVSPATDTIIAGCPARRFAIEVATDSGLTQAPMCVVLLDPGIYSIVFGGFSEETEVTEFIGRIGLKPGASAPPPPKRSDSLAFKFGIAVGSVAGLLFLGGIIALVVFLAVRKKRRRPPPLPRERPPG